MQVNESVEFRQQIDSQALKLSAARGKLFGRRGASRGKYADAVRVMRSCYVV